ncbi:MAG: SUMF1/EgtB/PvdO family nonheme iron enzyme [Rhodothermales bacterium]
MEQLFEGVRRARQTVHREHIQSLEQFQDEFEQLIRKVLTWHGRRLVVFIDDLDRCLPEKAIEVLEAIKLFMDVEGCIFVLGLDRDVIARGIEMKYRERGADDRQFAIDGASYLEKIIQVPFRIPPIEPGVMGSFVRNMMPEPLSACGDIFAAGMGESPRQVKRTVNTFLLLWKLASRAGLGAVRLAKIVAIQQIEPELYEQLRRMPHLMRDLEAYYRHLEHPEDIPSASRQLKDEARYEELAPALKPFARNATIRRILLAHSADAAHQFNALPADELTRYFTLTQRTEMPEPEAPARERRQAPLARPIEPQIVAIPAGSFPMGTSEGQATALRRIGLPSEALKMEMPRHQVALSAFGIGKYPVTNAEYLPFINDTGHRQPDHWQTIAIEGKESHPVVNVSWDDAMAFCAWLSRHTGKRYALPSEAQWEYACRAGSDTIYPFGDAPAGLDAHAWYEANSRGDTHPVGARQPNAWNVYDLLGNVWEWCADAFAADAYTQRAPRGVADPAVAEGLYRTLRGGSYLNAPQDVRCAARGSDYPFVRTDRIGFRVVLLPDAAS